MARRPVPGVIFTGSGIMAWAHTATRRQRPIGFINIYTTLVRFLVLLAFTLHAATHPLAPLTADEITEAARIIRQSGRAPDGARFVTLTLDDPAKDAVLRGEAPRRRAFAV